jgi:predicted outer membrane repeat protein
VATSAGGAVYGGPVTLDHSQVTANEAGDTGGGLGLFTGTLLDSQVTGNTARTRGGGIDASGSLTLTRSTIGTNTLSDGAYGAGIAADGPATLTDSQVVDNTGTILATHVDTRGGAGIYARSTLAVVRSTIAGNALVGSGPGPVAGGGIHVAGSATIDQSLLAGNTVDAGASTASGGGIFGAGGITITRSTLSGNEVHSTGVASGAAIHRELGTVSMQATTIAGNVGPTSLVGTMAVSAVVVDAPAGSAACSVPLTSYGFDVADDATCGLTAPGDLQGVDPLLGALADNGGPTRAHLPLLGSPLLDAIPLAAPSCTAFTADQRGLPRPTGAGCDIGAVER